MKSWSSLIFLPWHCDPPGDGLPIQSCFQNHVTNKSLVFQNHSAMWVQTLLRKWRSWDTTITVLSKSIKKSSNQEIDWMSRPLVGSSRAGHLVYQRGPWPGGSLTFSLLVNSLIFLVWVFRNIEVLEQLRASFSASQPPSSANSP